MAPRKIKAKATGWNGDDVKAWRRRAAPLGRETLTQEEAAALLRTTVAGICAWEQYRRNVPEPMILLMLYIERFGPLD